MRAAGGKFVSAGPPRQIFKMRGTSGEMWKTAKNNQTNIEKILKSHLTNYNNKAKSHLTNIQKISKSHPLHNNNS